MPGKKSAKEKKRKHSDGSHVERKRRSTESSVEDSKENVDHQGLDEPSDIEEGGLDLTVQFKPISAYVTDRREMLEQCFRVLGENKLKKMLPDELKNCTFDEIKSLCWEQLEQLSQSNLIQILEGEEVTALSDAEEEESRKKLKTDSQQDNNVDSTSSLKENVEVEDLKQGGASGEESDVLSINADTYDSDIEGPKEEVTEKGEAAAGRAESAPVAVSASAVPEREAERPPDPKRELQMDIEQSVCEILALVPSPCSEEPKELPVPQVLAAPDPPALAVGMATAAAPLPVPAPVVAQPSAQQLELLELEMRARAIKALMKANEVKKQTYR
ncbi:caspase activity and apoptosis inhibitor 1 isoform X2 [Megalops cyprinoides]|uniref:caspase activity and apoptosis inhibitor 1 isoform X2 n=1 Tax=Megalops cyprinoides TaxID=118141 RepID=UPI00186511CE|nr:caspase activity and apoptosis inhibitor 1 isoform X2 [Megalops cyprinoides]